jgi:hypothetical protein
MRSRKREAGDLLELVLVLDCGRLPGIFVEQATPIYSAGSKIDEDDFEFDECYCSAPSPGSSPLSGDFSLLAPNSSGEHPSFTRPYVSRALLSSHIPGLSV